MEWWDENARPPSNYEIPPELVTTVEPIVGGYAGKIAPTDSGVTRLGFLEGLEEFCCTWPEGPWCGTGLGPTFYRPTTIELSVSEEVIETLPEGTIKEGKSLIVDGDCIYLLNTARGLAVVDISNPAVPKVMTYVQIFGDPLDMIVQGDYGYILVEVQVPVWYDAVSLVWDHTWGTPTYRVCSRLVVVNLTDPENAWIERTYGLEGFAGAMFAVEDRLFIVSNCYDWCRFEPMDLYTMETNILTIQMMGPNGVELLDSLVLDGETNVVSFTDRNLLVGRMEQRNWRGWFTFTVLGLGGEGGKMTVLGSPQISGGVDTLGWVQWRGPYLWVITDDMSCVFTTEVNGSEGLELITEFEVGHDVDDVLFVGDFLYLLDAVYTPSRIYVVDIRDPNSPEEIANFTLDYYIEGLMDMEGGVLAYRTISSRSSNKFNLVLYPIVTSGGDDATLLPHITITRLAEEPEGEIELYNGPTMTAMRMEGRDYLLLSYVVKTFTPDHTNPRISISEILEWDAEAGDIVIHGKLEAYDRWWLLEPAGTLDYWLLNAPGSFLELIDLSDIEVPRYSVVVNLEPMVLDARCFEGACVRVVRLTYPDRTQVTRLWIGPIEDINRGKPDIQVQLGRDVVDWIWNGPYLHVLEGTYGEEDLNISLFTVDLSEPLRPVVGERLNLTLFQEPGHFDDHYNEHESYRRAFEVNYNDFSNPVLLDGKVLALASGGAIYLFNVTDPSVPDILKRYKYEYGRPVDIRAVGRSLHITDSASRLHRIDLMDPTTPDPLPILSIPGRIQGVSEDGNLYYTIAYWNLTSILPGNDYYGPSFNAVNITGDSSTIEWAIHLSSDVATIMNGSLFVFPDRPRWWFDGAYAYGVTTDVNTTIFSYEIEGSDAPRAVTEIVIMGDIGYFVNCDGFLLIGEEGYRANRGLIALDVRDADSIRLVGLFDVDWERGDVFHRHGDRVLVSSFDRGLAVLEIIGG